MSETWREKWPEEAAKLLAEEIAELDKVLDAARHEAPESRQRELEWVFVGKREKAKTIYEANLEHVPDAAVILASLKGFVERIRDQGVSVNYIEVTLNPVMAFALKSEGIDLKWELKNPGLGEIWVEAKGGEDEDSVCVGSHDLMRMWKVVIPPPAVMEAGTQDTYKLLRSKKIGIEEAIKTAAEIQAGKERSSEETTAARKGPTAQRPSGGPGEEKLGLGAQ